MNWFSITFSWYFVLFVIGLVFFPLTKLIFGRFFYDRGYPYAKTIGILLLTYTTFVFGILQILPFTLPGVLLVTALFIAINGYLFLRFKKRTKKFLLLQDKKALGFIIFEELLFFVAFVGYMVVRGQEPAIRGLEKFMDYGFMVSILRSDYFPPLDMWLSADPLRPSGYFINYYYFGHLIGAFLVKITQIIPAIGYNLILGTIFAQGVTLGFSLCSNVIYNLKKQLIDSNAISKVRLIFYGLLGSFIINLAGNLHTIYAFTKGYNLDKPEPFWSILLSVPEMLDSSRPSSYWYPNATRFIPKTIHEFPSYSYVVADLHGHVYDIPAVLLSLSLLFILLMYMFSVLRTRKIAQEEREQLDKTHAHEKHIHPLHRQVSLHTVAREFISTFGISYNEKGLQFKPNAVFIFTVLMGFMCAIHYMTNALNGPIYLLLTLGILFIYYGISIHFIASAMLLGFSFFVFSYPFSAFFAPFASGVGVNCAPKFLTDIQLMGPFLFEAGNCQREPFWMLFVLWGFFWIGLILLVAALLKKNKITHARFGITILGKHIALHVVDIYAFIMFLFGTFLIIIPEFFYVKDIYPDHFRANTMFKLGYQAFIMMSIAMVVTLFRIRLISDWRAAYALKAVYGFFFFFVFIYPFFAFPSYYPGLYMWSTYQKPPTLQGDLWLLNEMPQDKEIIDYLNTQVKGQPVILEAQGDSYTDYNRVSAYTGLPTVAGWWVHQWLWRGSADVVGARIPDIETIYNTEYPQQALDLLKKYKVEYVIVSGLEREKYPNLNQSKFEKIATEVFRSKNGVGSIYKISQ